MTSIISKPFLRGTTYVFMLMTGSAAFAAGPFDGTWTGGASNSAVKGCAATPTVDFKVAENKLTGTAQFHGKGPPLIGLVQPDGSIESTALNGKFNADSFAGEVKNPITNCTYSIRMKKS